MYLHECPDGVACFLDANVLSYCFVDLPPLSASSATFLDRVFRRALVGHTSADVVADVIHKVMVAQACAKYRLPRAGVVGRLRRQPEMLADLDEHEQIVSRLGNVGIIIHTVNTGDLRRAATISRQYGLLTGDALVLAVMQRLKLSHLATNDDDFERVPALTCYFPR